MRTISGPILRVQDLVKGYESLRALDGVSMELERGSVVALLGPNGAGKTTTFKCILGVTAFQGKVEVDGLPVPRRGREARRRIGYLPQAPTLWEADTCTGALEFLADLRGAGNDRIDALLQRVNLWEQRRQKVGHLSGGMRQRLALAAALLGDPPLLLLDEPTANLDAESRAAFQALVAELRTEGKTVVISTHFVDGLVELADRVVVLRRGRVVVDAPAGELVGHRRRYVVDLNGTTETDFLRALEGVGIRPDRVTPAEGRWEQIVAAISEVAPEATEEQEP